MAAAGDVGLPFTRSCTQAVPRRRGSPGTVTSPCCSYPAPTTRSRGGMLGHFFDPDGNLLGPCHPLREVVRLYICTIYGVDDDAGIPVIVMEYVEGETLASKLADIDLATADAKSIIRQVASGMEAAHEIGIVHGDLKPSNIMLTKGGTPKITDFGLSRRELVVLSGDDTVASGLDSERGISGTPNYMSPEQTNGMPASAAGDVFALGLVAYETATGRQAFSGDNLLQISTRSAKSTPSATPRTCPNRSRRS